jgi:hypothetical protein
MRGRNSFPEAARSQAAWTGGSRLQVAGAWSGEAQTSGCRELDLLQFNINGSDIQWQCSSERWKYETGTQEPFATTEAGASR